MTPIRHPETTAVLGAPVNWDEAVSGPCTGLPIVRGSDFMASYWKPSWREWLLILVGRPVRLSVYGAGHPPVHIDMEPT